MELQDLRVQVRKTLLVENLQIPQNPQMTATEINVRMEMARQMLAPFLAVFNLSFAACRLSGFWFAYA